jgi:predicted ATPase/DNA-binding CsgD family transcriptional regulator
VSELTRLLAPKDLTGFGNLSGLSPRLITITGAGGVGKTRLALQVCRDVAAQRLYADSVHVVSLAPIGDPALVVPTIAKTLGMRETPDRLLFESLKTFLRNKQALVLLDNFEQVITVAPLLADLLASCEQLRLLVTSREALQVRGEQVFPLAPLDLPDITALRTQSAAVEMVWQAPSAALFTQRAQACQPAFQLTSENALIIAELCAHLDGLPLAIELAAARINLLSPQAMLGRLQESPLHLLTGGARDLPMRQQTMRATIQWSYDLLSADEQKALRWLAIFVGGCTLAAAEALMRYGMQRSGALALGVEHSPLQASNAQYFISALDLIAWLVNKSLLRQNDVAGEPRLSMLETIREFGLEQLKQTGELAMAQHARTHHYLTLVEQAAQQLSGAEQRVWLARLERELDNLRAVWQWALEQRDVETALRLASALWRYWVMRGQLGEGRRWMEDTLTLLASSEVNAETYARALRDTGALAGFQADFARARELFTQSLTLYRKAGDKVGAFTTLTEFCRMLTTQGDHVTACSGSRELLAIADELNQPQARAEALSVLGRALVMSGQYVEARQRLEEALSLMRALNNHSGFIAIALQLGLVALEQGEASLPHSELNEALELARQSDDTPNIIRALLVLGRLDFIQRNYPSARLRFAESLRLGKETGLASMLVAVEALGVTLVAQGLTTWGVRVLSCAAEKHKATQSAPFVLMRQLVERALATARAQLDAQAFAAAWEVGRTLTFDDMLAIPELPAAPAPIPLHETLTARERDVLRLLAQRLSDAEIAERLVISIRTVQAHLRSIYDKFGVKSRDAAARYALDHQLISEP